MTKIESLRKVLEKKTTTENESTDDIAVMTLIKKKTADLIHL
jgi:hypothetical protein